MTLVCVASEEMRARPTAYYYSACTRVFFFDGVCLSVGKYDCGIVFEIYIFESFLRRYMYFITKYNAGSAKVRIFEYDAHTKS